MNDHTKGGWIEMSCPVPFCRAFRRGNLKVFCGKEPTGWHLSISHPGRYPSWKEWDESQH